MTILASNAGYTSADGALYTVQCDVCCPPWIGTNSLAGLLETNWQTTLAGASQDVCPVCLRRRLARELRPRRETAGGGSDTGALPTFITIGAAKSATTSLHAYLAQHPQIAMSQVKEPNYFCDPDHAQWSDYYRALFDPTCAVRGESTTLYSRYPTIPGVPERMAKVIPDLKIVFLVRDPVERALASYVEESMHDIERRPLLEAFADVEDPFNPYVSASRYALQLERYLGAFDDLRYLVLDMTDLRRDPLASLQTVWDFLEVPAMDGLPDEELLNTRATKRVYPRGVRALRATPLLRAVYRLPPGAREALLTPVRRVLSHRIAQVDPPPELLDRLRRALAPDAKEFRDLTGRAFDHWTV